MQTELELNPYRIDFNSLWLVQVILFEINCAIFYANLHELFCQFISWTNWVNAGKFMGNCWISCQVMADMEKVYENLIIINLYNIKYWQSMIRTHNIVTSLLFIFLVFSFLGLQSFSCDFDANCDGNFFVNSCGHLLWWFFGWCFDTFQSYIF